MKNDPIVEEVRRMRHEHAARFNYDMDLIVKDLKMRERAGGRPCISLPPRRTREATRKKTP